MAVAVAGDGALGGAGVSVAAPAATTATVAVGNDVGNGVAVNVATTFGVAGATVGGGAVRRLPITAAPSVYPVTMTTTTPAAISPQRSQGLPPKPEPLSFIASLPPVASLLPASCPHTLPRWQGATARQHHYTMTRAILARFLTALQNILQRFLPSAQEFAIITIRNAFVAGS
jgi:hypothetical protein